MIQIIISLNNQNRYTKISITINFNDCIAFSMHVKEYSVIVALRKRIRCARSRKVTLLLQPKAYRTVIQFLKQYLKDAISLRYLNHIFSCGRNCKCLYSGYRFPSYRCYRLSPRHTSRLPSRL